MTGAARERTALLKDDGHPSLEELVVGTEIRFGTDGWRAVIGDAFTFANVRLVARAAARHLSGEGKPGAPLVIGHDTRFQARAFAEAAAEAVAAEGIPVRLTRTFAPTPVVAFNVSAQGGCGGLVLTASHNPPAYLGIKVRTARGGSAHPAMTAAIEAAIAEVRVSKPPPGGARGGVELFDPWPAYTEGLGKFADLAAIGRLGAAIVVDSMYGATQGRVAEILRGLGCRVEELHAEVNPAFGGRSPEPLPGHVPELLAAMPAGTGRLRVGIAFDGDGDRIAAVDEAGRFVTPHHLFAVLLVHLAERRGLKGRVVKTFSVTTMVDRLAKGYGLPWTTTPIGFKHIAALMAEGGVLMGGEESGGLGFAGHIPERDALAAALLLLEAMAVTGRTLGELVAEVEARVGPHRYRRVDLHLDTPRRGQDVMARLKAAPPDRVAGRAVRGVEELDGVKFQLEGGAWLLVRPSGTEPVLRLYAEAGSEDTVTALLQAAEGMVG